MMSHRLARAKVGRISTASKRRKPDMSEDAPDDLPPAAKRALAEAEARRKAEQAQTLQKELGGREGPEPVRYGDWEKKGIAIDF